MLIHLHFWILVMQIIPNMIDLNLMRNILSQYPSPPLNMFMILRFISYLSIGTHVKIRMCFFYERLLILHRFVIDPHLSITDLSVELHTFDAHPLELVPRQRQRSPFQSNG